MPLLEQVGEPCRGRPGLDDAAAVEERDRVGYLAGEPDLVGDDDHRGHPRRVPARDGPVRHRGDGDHLGRPGRAAGITANAVSSLSLDPPLLLVCFDRSGHTLAAVGIHGAFAVNILAAPQRELSANFARRGPATDRDGVLLFWRGRYASLGGAASAGAT